MAGPASGSTMQKYANVRPTSQVPHVLIHMVIVHINLGLYVLILVQKTLFWGGSGFTKDYAGRNPSDWDLPSSGGGGGTVCNWCIRFFSP